MIVIGLTGSIGTGKTTAANMLREMGIPVFDSDAAVHELLGKGGRGIRPVFEFFPDSYDKKTESIDRRKLRDLLGKDHGKWDILESVLHPLVQEMQQDWMRAQRANGIAMAALDIPLLFETGAENRVDYTICVSCPPFMQRQRVLARSGMTEEDFAFRLSRQMPDAEKRLKSDFVVETGIGFAETRAELENVGRIIKDRRPRRENGCIPPHKS